MSKIFVKDIKNLIKLGLIKISEKQNKSVFIDITPGQLKLDLILKVKEFTNEENLDSFKDLIKKLKEINNKGLEIIKEIN